GWSVAVSGNSLVVGAIGEAAGGFAAAGHVYVFDDAGSLMTTLTSPNPQTAGGFGFGAAVSGDIVIVGSPGEVAGGSARSGHAYIFSNTGSLIATLTSPSPQTDGLFGNSVAVMGVSVLAGAPRETAGGVGFGGQVYIFSNRGLSVATLTSPNSRVGGFFGGSVGVNGKRVVVGAWGEDAGGFGGAGNAYLFALFAASTASP